MCEVGSKAEVLKLGKPPGWAPGCVVALTTVINQPHALLTSEEALPTTDCSVCSVHEKKNALLLSTVVLSGTEFQPQPPFLPFPSLEVRLTRTDSMDS